MTLTQRLEKLADRLVATTAFGGDAITVLEAAREISQGSEVRRVLEGAGIVVIEGDDARATQALADLRDTFARKLARYESAFGNIETMIDGKVDSEDGERSDMDKPSANIFGQIQSEIDEARR